MYRTFCIIISRGNNRKDIEEGRGIWSDIDPRQSVGNRALKRVWFLFPRLFIISRPRRRLAMHISLPANCLTPNQHPSVAFTFQIILLAGADNKVSGNASTETDNSLASPANDFSRLIGGGEGYISEQNLYRNCFLIEEHGRKIQ